MAHVTLAAQARPLTGSAAARRYRRQGLIPGILYQPGSDSLSFLVGERDLWRALHAEGGRTNVIELTVDGGTVHTAMVRDWQLHPVHEQVIHLDLQEVRMDEATVAEVPVVLVGVPVGVRDGGVLDHAMRSVSVRALPDAIPDHLEQDVTALEAGAALHVSDLVAPAGVEIISDPELVVAAITAASRAEVEEEEGGPDEPEIVGRSADAE